MSWILAEPSPDTDQRKWSDDCKAPNSIGPMLSDVPVNQVVCVLIKTIFGM